MKYRADLYSNGERIEGHITDDEHLFVWSPIIPALSRKLFGLDTFEVPISDLEGYQVKSSKIVIGIKGLPEFPRFRCKKYIKTSLQRNISITLNLECMRAMKSLVNLIGKDLSNGVFVFSPLQDIFYSRR